MMKFALKRNNELTLKLQLKSLDYIDKIVQIETIHCLPKDSLSVTWDVTIQGFTNGEKTSELPIKFSYLKEFNEDTEVRFCRLTMINGKGLVQTYSEFPTVYIPDELTGS